mgnify:CR=1 FL=1
MKIGYPDTLNSVTSPLYKKVPASTIKTKTTQELKNKNDKETKSFKSSAISQEANNPNNVSTQKLEYKSKGNKVKEKEKFKAVKDGKLYKYVNKNGKVRESERKITAKAQARKAKRWTKK